MALVLEKKVHPQVKKVHPQVKKVLVQVLDLVLEKKVLEVQVKKESFK